jgi:hypothetical protein
MLANEERLAAQLIDPSPLTRIGAQVCLKDLKCNSTMMLKGNTSGTGTIIVNKSFNLQESTTTLN